MRSGELKYAAISLSATCGMLWSPMMQLLQRLKLGVHARLSFSCGSSSCRMENMPATRSTSASASAAVRAATLPSSQW
jgi:hypothetical protein